MSWPLALLIIGLVLVIVGETWGIIRKVPGEDRDTITEFVRMIVKSDRGWIAVPGAILIGGGMIWALFHFFAGL